MRPQRLSCLASFTATLHGSAFKVACEICESTDHESQYCNSDLKLAEKTEILSSKGVCFRCTKKGHMARQCKVRIACKKCSHQHATSMCNPTFASHQKDMNTKTIANEQVSLHASEVKVVGTTHTVIMLTVTAWNKRAKTKKLSRIFFHSGSQRTFTLKSAHENLVVSSLEPKLSQSMFWGDSKTEQFSQSSGFKKYF